MFPLRAAHESQHDRHAFAIGLFDHGVVGNLQLPAQQVKAKIFGVVHDGRVPLRVPLEQQVGRVHAAADQVIASVDLQVEVAAGADVGKAVVRIAGLRDVANAEIDGLRVRYLSFVIDFEVQFQMIEFCLAPLVRPPQIGILHSELGVLGRCECDFRRLVSKQSYRLLEPDRALPGT